MANPWRFKAYKRGQHGGEFIKFFFQGRDFMQTSWYPPWQNDQQRENASQIVHDLNAAFKARNEPEKSNGKKVPRWLEMVRWANPETEGLAGAK